MRIKTELKLELGLRQSYLQKLSAGIYRVMINIKFLPEIEIYAVPLLSMIDSGDGQNYER